MKSWELLPPSIYFVACFFVLSGYAIERSLNTIGIIKFSVQRLFRIYPVFLIGFLLAFAASSWMGLPTPDARDLAKEASLYGGYTLLPQAWTLLVEIRFYIVAAILALVTRNISVKTAILMFILFSTTCLSSFAPPTYGIGSLSSLTDLFFWLNYIHFGSLFYHHRGTRANWILLILHTAGFFLCWFVISLAPFASIFGSNSFVPLMAAVLTLGGVLVVDEKLPNLPILNFLGSISYPLYVIHISAGWLTFWVTFQYVGGLLAYIMGLVASLLLATIIHHLIELPAQRVSKALFYVSANGNKDLSSIPKLP